MAGIAIDVETGDEELLRIKLQMFRGYKLPYYKFCVKIKVQFLFCLMRKDI